MTKLSVHEIQKLGFDWPPYPLVEQYSEMQDGKVDLSSTLENLRSSRAFYRGQLNQAFAFKQQTGADYSDFTDRHDEYARIKWELDRAIAYLEEIVQASDQ